MNETIIFWISLLILIYIIGFIGSKRQDQEVIHARQALKTYVFTGKETKAFRTLGGPLIKTAKSWRNDYLEDRRRAKENDAIDYGFNYICECPRCLSVDSHHMTGNMAGRQCKGCGYIWHVPN